MIYVDHPAKKSIEQLLDEQYGDEETLVGDRLSRIYTDDPDDEDQTGSLFSSRSSTGLME